MNITLGWLQTGHLTKRQPVESDRDWVCIFSLYACPTDMVPTHAAKVKIVLLSYSQYVHSNTNSFDGTCLYILEHSLLKFDVIYICCTDCSRVMKEGG